jgi:23S rRNA (uracil1939-C5)-methyltransferase
MLARGQIFDVAIEKPAAGGRMIGRIGGQVVLVAGAIPGEHVRARVERISKGVAFAETVGVDEASPDRREPQGDSLCGGCLFNYIAYPRQLEIKSQVIADAFARVGHLTLPGPVGVAASQSDGYRMRARLHVRDGRIGFFREGTHDVCDPRQTRQLLPATCDALERMAALLRTFGHPHGLQAIELSENVDASQRVVHLDAARPLDSHLADRLHAVDGVAPGPYVTDTLSFDSQSITLRRHVLAFFQGNRYLLRDLVAHVIERVPSASTVADLYAGAGLFAIASAVVRGASVVAVEGDRLAADDLFANASAAGGQVTTRHMAVEHFIASIGVARKKAGEGRLAETVIVDPPRTGMSREALDVVLQLDALRLIYVSCDVATLARDARRIVDAGYTIARADAFDLFPNTPHVETVVVFNRS